MLSFKQFISEMYLTEATAKHFAHLNLDPNNPEHKDLIDAYNAGHSSNDPNVPRHPGQIKSIDQFKSAVSQHLEKIKQKRQEAEDDKRAFESGEANVIHHNPETGAKVIQVSTQAGSCAAGAPSTWCTGKRGSADMVKHYDPEGNHSFVFHFPNEKDKNLRTIGAYGKYKEGSNGTNFQNKENHTVPRDEWHRLDKEHGLDKIKHLKGVVRGIGITDAEKDQYSKELTHNIKNGTASDADVKHASAVGYLTDQHKKDLVSNENTSARILHTLAVSDPEVHKSIINHTNVGDNTLSEIVKKSNDPEVHKSIINHPNVGDSALHEIVKKSNDKEIHKAILNHPNVGDSALSEIVKKSDDPEVHKSIINHPNVGDSALHEIASHSRSIFGRNPKELDKVIVNHPKAKDMALSNIAAQSNDKEIHKAILAHPNAGRYAIENIAAQSNDKEIHKAILAHPEVEDYSLSEVARNSTDPEIHKAILAHPNAGRYALREVAEQSSDPEIHKAIAKHKNAGDSALLKVADKTYDPEIHKAIVKNPKAGDNALRLVAMKSDDPEIHKAIVAHTNAGNNAIHAVAKKNDDPEIHRTIMNHERNSNYDVESSIKRIHDPETHSIMLKHYGSNMDNGQIKELTKKYGLPEPYIQKDESNYDNVSPENLEKVKHHLSKLAARTEAAKNRSIDTGTEKEPLVTPIKSRQRRYNFTEQLLAKIKG